MCSGVGTIYYRCCLVNRRYTCTVKCAHIYLDTSSLKLFDWQQPHDVNLLSTSQLRQSIESSYSSSALGMANCKGQAPSSIDQGRQWCGRYGHGRTVLREKKWRRLIPIYACVFSSSVCRSSRRQSMTKPSQDIFEVSSVQSCDKRTGAFSPHSDARPAREMWAGLTCAKFSVACLRTMATFKNEARSSLLANPHHISASIVWKSCSCEIFPGTLVSSSFVSCSNYR